MDRSVRQCGGIFLTTVAIAVVLRCAWEVWPGTLLGLFAPRNTSVWELSKIGLWPGIAAAVLYHVPLRDKSSLCAYLMVPAALPVALLFVYWFLRMVCGICSGLCRCGGLGMSAGCRRGNGPFRPSDGLCRAALPMVGRLLLESGRLPTRCFPAWGGSADFYGNDAAPGGSVGRLVKM